jgi:hypothetical protein
MSTKSPRLAAGLPRIGAVAGGESKVSLVDRPSSACRLSAGLLDAFDYCALVASELPERFDRAARRWLSLLLTECEERLTLDDVQLALVCLRSLPVGDAEQLRATLRALLKRTHALQGR